MFYHQKEFKMVLQAQKKLKAISPFCEEILKNYSIQKAEKFNASRFLVFYNYCFLFYIKNIFMIFLNEKEIECLSFQEFETIYSPRKTRQILDCFEKLSKKNQSHPFWNFKILSVHISLWSLVTGDSTIRDLLSNSAYEKLEVSNENLLLTNAIEQQRDEVFALLQEIAALDIKNKVNTRKLDSLAGSFSKKLLISVEILCFRNFLVDSFFKIPEKTFSNFNYLQLILLYDAELITLIDYLLSFIKDFSKVYKKYQNIERSNWL